VTHSTATPFEADPTVALHRAATAVPRLLWAGPVFDPSGHADELRGFVRALERAGYEPVLREVPTSPKPAGLSQSDIDMLRRQLDRDTAGTQVAAFEYLPDPIQHVIPGAVNVHRAMFETDTLPTSWTMPLIDRDEVWVPSEFNVETFARGGIPEDRLKVLGGTLDFDLFAPGVDPLDLGAPDGSFTFLVNFDFSERKGWRQLVRAWARAFAPTDPVCLVLKVGNLLSDAEKVRARIQSFIDAEHASAGGLAPIRVISNSLTATAMPSLYAGADAYVAASRGEGWGRPYMEAMAMGLPTIGSNWSANLEFMDAATTWLVDGELVDIPSDAELFVDLYGGHRWFEPDGDALVAALQDVAGDPDAARRKAAPARADLIRRFGPDATAARIAELASAAWERHGERRLRPLSVAIRASFGPDGGPSSSEAALAIGLGARDYNIRVRGPLRSAHINSDAPTITYDWDDEKEPLTDGPAVAVVPLGFEPAKGWVDAARRRIDRVWVHSDADRDRLVAAGLPPGVVDTIGAPDGREGLAERAEASLASIRDEAQPLARAMRRASIDARSRFAVYAPDWNDDPTWGAALDGWLEAFGPDDDVTLALYVDGDADAIGARIMSRLAGRDESTLPDLALVVPSSTPLTELGASADAVVTDGPIDPAARPELLRRARRIVRAGDQADVNALAVEFKDQA
jgi:glycosyltransferase involved in cell wall biosynthesis